MDSDTFCALITWLGWACSVPHVKTFCGQDWGAPGCSQANVFG
jgi:hypothetical protein